VAPEQLCFAPYQTKFPVPPSLHGPSRLRAWAMAVAGFQAVVKLDSQSLPCEAHNLTINGKSDIKGGYVEFEGSDQLPQAVHIPKNMHLKRQGM
jgi:hypothetical protein